MLTKKEVEYLKSQRLARIATASPDGQPDVAVVGFEFDGACFYVGGLDITKTLKYINTLRNPRAAIVIDDLESTDPWTPRGLKLRGVAEVIQRQGRFGVKPFIRIKPQVKWTWGIEEPAVVEGKPNVKRIKL